MDLVWDRPTKFFKVIKKYFGENKGIENYRKRKPVVKDGNIGKLAHNMFKNSYHSSQPHITYATQYINDFGLQMLKENNGKESSLLSRLWRIDLEPMSRWINIIFNEIPDIKFDSPELDGKDEIAKAHVWIGYDFIWNDIQKHIFEVRPERKLPNTNIDDHRVKSYDLVKILDVLKVNDVALSVRQSAEEESSFIGFNYLKENTILPVSYRNRFGMRDHWALFPPYSIISMEGKPAKVRKSVMDLFAICSNETDRGLSGIVDSVHLDLECLLSSQHLYYHQWKPPTIRGC